MNKYNNYIEETKPLFRLLRTEAFRFIIIRYNHYSLVQHLKSDLFRLFPNRSEITINAKTINYRQLIDRFYKLANGFFYIENFEEILDNPDIYRGLNQRRDKLATYPIAIIAFISSSTDELFARRIMEKMPDLWSFRSLILDLTVEKSQLVQNRNRNQEIVPEPLNFNQSSLGGKLLKEKEKELNRLLKRIESVPESEHSLLITIYNQIAKIYADLWKYDKAIEYYSKVEKIELVRANNFELGNIYNDIGIAYYHMKVLDKALEYLLKSKRIYAKWHDNNGLGHVFNNIGLIYSKKNKLDKALIFYLESIKRFENSGNDNALGATFNNVALISQERKQFDAALKYFEKSKTICEKTGDELGLGSTFYNIASTYLLMGELEKALMNFHKSENIFIKLEAIPSLSVVYSTLGLIYYNMKVWNKALEYYNKSILLYQALDNKESLVNDFFIIGKIYINIGDLKKGNDYIMLAGYIAMKNNLKAELSEMDSELAPIIKELGQDKFMEEGQRLYEEIVLK